MIDNKDKSATVSRGKHLPDIVVRKIEKQDLSEIVEVARTFFEYESDYDDEWCEENYKASVEFFFVDQTTETFVATHSGVIVGFFCVSWASLYTKRPIMYEVHFAVHPNYVRSSTGRDLTKAVIKHGEEIGALKFYSGSTSGIKSFDNSIINMYTRCGMVASGRMMRYDYGSNI